MILFDEKILKDALSAVILYAPKIVLALLTLIIGLWIVNQITSIIRKKLEQNKIDLTLTPFLISMFSVLAKVMLLLSVASILGVETTSFIAILGAAGFAVGLALQGSLANFAGGVLILILRPFKPGDYVTAQGYEGFVKEIQILVTTIYTADNQQIIIPNGPLAAGNIVNYTAVEHRRVNINFIIGYDNKLEDVRKILLEIAAADKRVLQKDASNEKVFPKGSAPAVIFSLNEFTVGVSFRVWANPYDHNDVHGDISEAVKAKIGNGINGPRPSRDIFMYQGQVD